MNMSLMVRRVRAAYRVLYVDVELCVLEKLTQFVDVSFSNDSEERFCRHLARRRRRSCGCFRHRMRFDVG